MRHWAADAAMVVGVISGKWSVMILSALEKGPLRHNDLHRAVGNGIHVTVLDASLRRLEAAGLVSRDTDPGTPPATWYELTGLSRALLERLRPLAQWAQENRAELSELPGWPGQLRAPGSLTASAGLASARPDGLRPGGARQETRHCVSS